MSLVNAARAESTKLFSTSIWWILAIVLAVYVAFTSSALGFVLSASATGALGGRGPQPDAAGLPAMLYSTATAVGYVFPLLIGTLLVTAEFRHKTLTPTFLATPRRARVLWGKVAVGVVIGVIYAVIGIAASVGPAAGFLVGYGLDTGFGASDTWALIGRMVIAFVLWVLVGIGVGALVRNQVGAIVGVLVFTQFIEPIGRVAGTFVQGLSDVTRFLPGAAGDALVGSSIFSGATGATTSGTLEWWAGGLVLLGYAVVLLVLGSLVSWRRDIN
ncbi:ABC transporter permease [Microbacterium sp. CJ88]|uniref:ABC transporter permease n=1 Tax=Microbacterium sp. CJ88 TaxID=3445672 RepID=UPI003F658FBB